MSGGSVGLSSSNNEGLAFFLFFFLDGFLLVSVGS